MDSALLIISISEVFISAWTQLCIYGGCKSPRTHKLCTPSRRGSYWPTCQAPRNVDTSQAFWMLLKATRLFRQC